jgi:hypothetical protein
MEINLKMFNHLNEEVTITNYDLDNLETKHITNIDLFLAEVSQKNPDCTIKCKWREQPYFDWNFVGLQAYNEKVDGAKVESGEMEFQDWMKKWYPRLHNNLDDFKGLTITNYQNKNQ